jgi:hypothetical protein
LYVIVYTSILKVNSINWLKLDFSEFISYPTFINDKNVDYKKGTY